MIVVGILGGKSQIWGVKKGVTITILVWGVSPYFSLATLYIMKVLFPEDFKNDN